MAEYSPFPTFNPGGEGGIIPTIKMPQTRMSFPTPRGGGSGSRKPKGIEQLAGILPYGIQAAFDYFKKSPEILTAEKYYETIRPEGAPASSPTELEKARYQAYQVVGPEQKDDRFDAETIALLAGSLATGRGSDQYNQTLRNIRSSEQTASNAIETRRASIIQDYLKDKKVPFENYLDLDALVRGDGRVEVTGYNHPNDGLLLRFPDHPEAYKTGPYKGYVQQSEVEGNFVQSGTFDEDRIKGFKDKDVEDMMSNTAEFNAHDIGTFDTILTINSLIDTLQSTETDVLAVLGGAFNLLADDIETNLSNITNAMGMGRDPMARFSQNSKGGTQFKGTGLLIQDLKLLTDDRKERVENGENTDELDEEILAKYDAYHAAMVATGDERLAFTLFGEDTVDKKAFDRVTALSDYITLGYQVAGTRFGQTGRTLSDKDLAFALQSIGYGATQNDKIAVAQLMKVGYAMITQNDIKIRYTHNPGDYAQLPWNDNKINAYKNYWEPDIKGSDGNFDWTSDSANWKYLDTEERAKRRLGEDHINPIARFKTWKSHLFDPKEFVRDRKKIKLNNKVFTRAQQKLLESL